MSNHEINMREELRLILHRGLDQLSVAHPRAVKEWLSLNLEHWAMNSPEPEADAPETRRNAA